MTFKYHEIVWQTGQCKIYFHTKRSANPRDNQGRGPLVARAGKPAASQAPQVCSEMEGYRGIVVGKCCGLGIEPKCEEVIHSITTPLGVVFYMVF